jgi:elongator complex protein 3
MQACKTIAREIEKKRHLSGAEILKIIKLTCSKYKLNTLPKNEDILRHLSFGNDCRNIFLVKPIKTASGVITVAVMPKPFECPHGRCIYCPGGIEFNTPLSYVGSEPSTRAAQKFEYDPYEQIRFKLNQLQSRGHHIGKVEIVIVGGTFPFMPIDYQKDFAKSCFDALNGMKSATMREAMKINETSANRCVGFTVETKPDFCKKHHIDLMLEMGVTRVEIGIQSLRNEVYQMVNRGHDVEDVIESFKVARDAGYKIVAHMMPGLPNSSPEKDIHDFKRLFEDQCFRPDMLKIYPTLVLRHTGLYKLYQTGRYKPYSDNDLMDVLIALKKMVPEWTRIMRVQREIEPKDIVAGPKCGNLRQRVLMKLHELGLKCKCIRCREIGITKRHISEDEVFMNRIDYFASNGHEVFLAFESLDRSTILGFLRLRKTANPHREELREKNCKTGAIVRELHVYGQMLNVGNKGNEKTFQHKGYGMQLMHEAERIAKEEFGVDKLSVISAVGTKQYYKKLGYSANGAYVSKVLTS